MSGVKVILLFGTVFLLISLASTRTLGEEPLDDDGVTGFSCHGKPAGGFYADVTSGCRVFHACVLNAEATTLDIPFACVNGTLFDQHSSKCLPDSEVNCEDTQSYFTKVAEDMLENKVSSEILRRRRQTNDDVEIVEDKPSEADMMVKEFPFPKYSAGSLPKTHFSCRDKEMGGYYADPETDCQMFHICALGFMGDILDFRFLCLNATLFNAKTKKCEDFQNVECPGMISSIKTTMLPSTEEQSETKTTENSRNVKDEAEGKLSKDEEMIEEEEEESEKSDDKNGDRSGGKNSKKETVDDEENESDDVRGNTKKKPTEDKKTRPVPLKDLDYVDEENDESAPIPIIVAPSFEVIREGYRYKRQVFIPPPDPKSAPCYDYNNLPKTPFTCRDKVPGGYYADPVTNCQMYHICIPGPIVGKLIDFKFLCTNNTVFDQQTHMCRQFESVDCASSIQYYEINPEFVQAEVAAEAVEEKMKPEAEKIAEVEAVAANEAKIQAQAEGEAAGESEPVAEAAGEIAAEEAAKVAAETVHTEEEAAIQHEVPFVPPLIEQQPVTPEIPVLPEIQKVPESTIIDQPVLAESALNGQSVIPEAGLNGQSIVPETLPAQSILPQTPLNGQPIVPETALNGDAIISSTNVNGIPSQETSVSTNPLLSEVPLTSQPAIPVETLVNGQPLIEETPLSILPIQTETPLNGELPIAQTELNGSPAIAETPLISEPLPGESIASEAPAEAVNAEPIVKETVEGIEEKPLTGEPVSTEKPLSEGTIPLETPTISKPEEETVTGQQVAEEIAGGTEQTGESPENGQQIAVENTITGEPTLEETPLNNPEAIEETLMNNQPIIPQQPLNGEPIIPEQPLNGEPIIPEQPLNGEPIIPEQPLNGEPILQEELNNQEIIEESVLNGQPNLEETPLNGQELIAPINQLPFDQEAGMNGQLATPELEINSPIISDPLREGISEQVPATSPIQEISQEVPPIGTPTKLPQEQVVPNIIQEQNTQTPLLPRGQMIPPGLNFPFEQEPFLPPMRPPFFGNFFAPRPFMNESRTPKQFTKRPKFRGIFPPIFPNFGMPFPMPFLPRHFPMNLMFPLQFPQDPMSPMFPSMGPPISSNKFSPVTTETTPGMFSGNIPLTRTPMRTGSIPPYMNAFPEPLLGLGSTTHIKKKVKSKKPIGKEFSRVPLPVDRIPEETVFDNKFQAIPAGSEFIELWLQPPPMHVHAIRIARELQERPNINKLPKTSFTCQGKITGGYYADLETGCQMFHICARGTNSEVFDFKFLCTNNTVFNQPSQTCDLEERVNCENSVHYYPKEPEKEIEVPDAEISRTHVRTRRALKSRQEVVDGNSDEEDPFPQTSFTCRGKPVGGYYADAETECRIFHVCSRGEKGKVIDFRFRCANDTAFNQRTRTCDEMDEVDCDNAAILYNLDDEFFDVPRNSNDDSAEDNDEEK